jgi:hypothetical protein
MATVDEPDAAVLRPLRLNVGGAPVVKTARIREICRFLEDGS